MHFNQSGILQSNSDPKPSNIVLYSSPECVLKIFTELLQIQSLNFS